MKVLTKFGIVVVVLAMVTSTASAGIIWFGDPFLRGDDAMTVDGIELEVDYDLKMAEVGAIPILDVDGNPVLDGDGNPTFTPADNVSLSLTNGGSLVVGNKFFVGHGQALDLGGGFDSSPISGGTATFTMEAGTTLTTGQDLEMSYYAGTTSIGTLAGTLNIGDDFRVAGNDHNDENTTSTVTMNDATMTVGSTDNDGVVEVGRYGNGTLTLNGTSSIVGIHSSSDFEIGQDPGGVGVVNMNGTSSISFNDKLRIGEKGGTGTLNMTDNAVINGKDLDIGDRGFATINMSGASSINASDDVELAHDISDGTAVLNITDDAVLTMNDEFKVGRHGTGTINISGNALIDIGDDLELGKLAEGVGTLNMSGGTINIADDFEMSKANDGDFGTSYVYMSGGKITIGDDFKLAQKGGTATVVMTAGLIEVGDSLRITHEGQPGTSGTLVLGDGSDPDALFGKATITADDLNMNTAGNDGVISWIDFQPGGLLQLNGDVMAYIQGKIDGGYIMTTYAGLINGSAAEVGYDFGITEVDMTSVYLVPEPATMLLLGLGGLLLRRKR